jgi:hypothetical protein
MRLERARAADLAARLFGRGTPQALELLRASWPHAVGPDLSRRTEVVAVEGATLRIRVPDAGWRRVLHHMQPEILARLGQVAGTLAPRRLGFVEGRIAEPPPAAPGARAVAAPTPCPARVAEEAAAITDPELRAKFLETAGRYLARSTRRAVP